jgi:hypothetical protein
VLGTPVWWVVEASQVAPSGSIFVSQTTAAVSLEGKKANMETC